MLQFAPLPEKTLLVLFGDPIVVRDARGHGQPLAATKQKVQGEKLVNSDEVMLRLCRIDVLRLCRKVM